MAVEHPTRPLATLILPIEPDGAVVTPVLEAQTALAAPVDRAVWARQQQSH